MEYSLNITGDCIVPYIPETTSVFSPLLNSPLRNLEPKKQVGVIQHTIHGTHSVFTYMNGWLREYTLVKTIIAPENGWVEYDEFSFRGV